MTTLDSRKTGQQEEDGKAAETVYQWWFPEKNLDFFLSLKLKGVAYDNVLLTPSEEHCTVEKL